MTALSLLLRAITRGRHLRWQAAAFSLLLYTSNITEPPTASATLNPNPQLWQGIEIQGLQVKEGKTRLGSGWPAKYAVNERAQSGLALIHILAALGYDWGLQVLLPLGAELNLQARLLY